MSRLQAYTLRLYPKLEQISGQDIGLHYTGGLNVAATPERWDLLRSDAARHKVLGLDTRLVTPAEVRERCPLMDVSDVLGALYDPMEGYLDPYSATIAYAKAARAQGAEIYRHTRVLALGAEWAGHLARYDRPGNDRGRARRQRCGPLGARGRAAWLACDCRSCQWSTTTSSPRTCPKSQPQSASCPWSSILMGRCTCGPSAAACLLGVYETQRDSVGPRRNLMGLWRE